MLPTYGMSTELYPPMSSWPTHPIQLVSFTTVHFLGARRIQSAKLTQGCLS
jgi:hypothetical protein